MCGLWHNRVGVQSCIQTSAYWRRTRDQDIESRAETLHALGLSVSVPLVSQQDSCVTTRDFNHEITLVDQRVIARWHVGTRPPIRHRYGLIRIRTFQHSRTPAL